MKKVLSVYFLLFLSTTAICQTQVPYKYFVAFKDKNGTPYTLNNPSEFLSQRAIDRRARYSIPYDNYDLPVNPSYVQNVVQTGVTFIGKTKWLNGVIIYTTDTNKIATIRNMSFVKEVRLVGYSDSTYINKINKKQKGEPIEANYPINSVKDIYSFYDYGTSFNQAHQIKADVLHDQGYRGAGMVIAVLDAGFTHVNTLNVFQHLYTNGRILGKRNFIENDTNVFQGSTHGTMVLSTMGGYLPGQLVGTAPEASYWLLRTEDASSEYIVEEYFWACGAEFADSVGADVINSSLGYTRFDAAEQDHEYSDMNGNTCPSTIAADIAASRGILVVNSAGNSGSSPWRYIGAPSDGDSVLAVGAINANGEYVSFSSIGPSADGDVKPNVAAKGFQATVCDMTGGATTGNGTSFSSPIMAGAAACLWQAFPNKNNIEIKKAIEQSASQYNNPDSLLGYGIPDLSLAQLILTGSPELPDKTKRLLLYPNPCSDKCLLFYHSSQNQTIHIELNDTAGKKIYTQKMLVKADAYYSIPINTSNLKAGNYTLTLRDNKNKYSQQFIKQ